VVPDPSVQPPEGLRRLISKALFVVDWDIEPGTYLSTACDHGLHDRCRISCKFCGSYCVCRDCDHDPEPDQP
jgi:hypothetical protein